MIYSQWNIPRSKPVIPDALTRAGFSRLLAAVLAVRYDSPEEARQFLDVDGTTLGDPLCLKDMEKAARRLKQAMMWRQYLSLH